MQQNKKLFLPVFSFFFLLVWTNSFIWTNDIANWWVENILTFVSLLFLIVTYRYFKFSNTSYFFITLFMCLHVFGSKYTYADNVFGYWLKETMNLERNPYDRIVHFSFGLLLYYPLKEFLFKWLKYPVSIAVYYPIVLVLALSGAFEIVEWLIADIFFREQGDTYLGTQGDIWDAQKDMALAFLGSVISCLFFYRRKQKNLSIS